MRYQIDPEFLQNKLIVEDCSGRYNFKTDGVKETSKETCATCKRHYLNINLA